MLKGGSIVYLCMKNPYLITSVYMNKTNIISDYMTMHHQIHPSFHPACRCSSLPFAVLRHPIAHRTVVWQKATCRAKPRQPNNPPVSNTLHPGPLQAPPYRGNPFEYASDRKEAVAVPRNQNRLGNHEPRTDSVLKTLIYYLITKHRKLLDIFRCEQVETVEKEVGCLSSQWVHGTGFWPSNKYMTGTALDE